MDIKLKKQLAKRITSRTKIPDLKKTDWNEDVLKEVNRFVSTDQTVLFLYYDGSVLKGDSRIPNARSGWLAWFYKSAVDEDGNKLWLDENNFDGVVRYLKYLPSEFVAETSPMSETTINVVENVLKELYSEILNRLSDTHRNATKLTDFRYTVVVLEYKSIYELLTILDKNRPVSSTAFKRMMEKLTTGLIEAESNLNYLQVLMKSCTELYAIISPDEILYMLPETFTKIIYIFEESPYYNRPSDMNRLCDYLGNQIIFICRRTIDIKILFEGNVEATLESVHKCINCCNHFIEMFKEAVSVHQFKYKGKVWIKAKAVYAFLERLKDIEYICKAMMVFQRMNIQQLYVPKPKFSFVKGFYFEKIVESIELRFNDIVKTIENVVNTIFNLKTSDWFHHIQIFRDDVRDLCSEVEHLLSDALNASCNIEDALYVLQTLHYFSNWPQLQLCIQQKTNDIYKMLTDNITTAMMLIPSNIHHIPSFLTKYPGICCMSIIDFKMITNFKNMLVDRPWLVTCPSAKIFHKNYIKYVEVFHNMMETIFKMWTDQFYETDFEKRLDKRLLSGSRKSKYHWSFQINLDEDMRVLMNEIESWLLIEFRMPYIVNYLADMTPKIKNVYRNITMAIKSYDYFVAGLSEHELPLFGEKIQSCNKILSPLVIQNSIMIQIVDSYNEIVRYGSIVYEGFEDHITDVVVHWEEFVGHIDILVRESLILNSRWSMENMLELRIGYGFGPVPIFQIHVSIEGRRIKYVSDLMTLAMCSIKSLPSLVIAFKSIPRLSQTFKTTNVLSLPYGYEIAEDKICNDIQHKIEMSTQHGLREIRQYMSRLLSYSDIWIVDKPTFFENFRNSKPSAENFDIEITQYLNYIQDIKKLHTVSSVSYFVIRTSLMIKQIISHCQLWIHSFSQLLLEITAKLIEGIYEYTNVNSIRVMTPPKTIFEMVSFTEYRNKLVLECAIKENDFWIIGDNITILEKHSVDIPDIMRIRYNNMMTNWNDYKAVLESAEAMLEGKRDEFLNVLLNKQEVIKQQSDDLLQHYYETMPTTSDWKSADALDYIDDLKKKLALLEAAEEQLKADLALFGVKYVPSYALQKLKEELATLELVWSTINEWDVAWERYKYGKFWEIKVSEMEITAQSLFKKLNQLVKELRERKWEVLETTRNAVDAFRRVLPLITDLKNPSMRARHWDEVRRVIQSEFDETDETFTLEMVIGMGMQNFEDEISEISTRASMEANIENALRIIRETWDNMKLSIEPYKNQIYRLKAADDITQALEDQLVQISSMKGSKYISIFLEEADYWEKGLGTVMEVLEMTLNVQRLYIYLENIFVGDDIREKMPNETREYGILTSEWKKITSKMYHVKNVFKACNSKSLLKHLNTMNDRLQSIQRALEVYMETKRHVFPRFYFISNDDLLEILGNSKNPEMIQPHLKKCFDNITRVKMNSGRDQYFEAIGMYSDDGEYVPWVKSVMCEGPVEFWLVAIESAMRASLKSMFKEVKLSLLKNLKNRDVWILNWPGQLCITASQIQWTTDCTRALIMCKQIENKLPLKKIRKKQKKVLSKFSDAIRGNLPKTARLKVVALVTIEIHARDVIEKMYKNNCMDVTAFEWMSQLRFYWDKKISDIVIRQTNTRQLYGYEYLGNSGRLVITPLTDRCYITLTTALHLFRGGSPKGPAGTGKTETVKDLGKNLAYYVIVINCSEGHDYMSMGRNFSGLAQQGAWGCFDEFNRINIEVLSVVAQQILSIFSALAANKTSFVFERNEIRLISTCGIFITMNPGYAGRTELPDNLKSMFRAISMMVPDSKLIAEIMLFGEGFKDTRNLANKVFVLFSLCKQQLSKQDHYEFGLRGMVALLRYSGQCRRLYSHLPNEEVLLLAMQNMNLAKLTQEDLPLFMGITNDLFINIILPPVKNDILIDAITTCMVKRNLQPSKAAIAKIVQLYETQNSRHSVMVLGQTGAAKSTTWKILRDASALLKKNDVSGFEVVIEYPMNPKALSLGELYGENNLATQEWMDGVLSSIMRKVCSDSSIEKKWILFDGPVDAVWIENMNSVMDDNKVLTLINSERITMPQQVSLLFEVEDLAVASPATVSRCGIVFNDYNDFGWKLYVDSWLSLCNFEPYRMAMKIHFDNYIDNILVFKKMHCTETVTIPELSLVMSCCKLLECFTFEDVAVRIPKDYDEDKYMFLTKIWFLFCMLWSVCAGVNENGRKKIDIYIRELERVFPVRDTVYHYYVDTNFSRLNHWEDRLPSHWTYDSDAPFFKIIVPTVDTVRYNYLTEAYLSKKQPVLLVGPVGTGKTSTAQKALESLNKNTFSFLTINMSAQTTSNNVQEAIEGRLEKRTKELYAPMAGKTMITFLDDMNMPAKEVYGAQPPLELIRQWIDYEFWYDRQKQTIKYVKKMLLIGAMGPPGGGRNTISNRLMSSFSIINLTFPEESQIFRIYGLMLQQHLKDFNEDVFDSREGLTTMTVDLYSNVVSSMLPTPAKMHYLFNLRDISKVFQGLLRSSTDFQNAKASILRLWCHEVFRVFSDRLVDINDREWFSDQVNNQLGKNFDLTYRSLCSSDNNPIFCDFLNKYVLYEEVLDEKVLHSYIYSRLDEYNASFGVIPMNLVLFRDAIDHVCRIARVISQPRGYMLIVGIGGSGRSSLARLATWLCNYNMFTIELTKSYGTMEFKEDLKALYALTGVKDQPTTFLFNDTQIANESFLEIINNILSTGEVSKLYKGDEFEEIKSSLTDIAKRSGVLETAEAIYSFFIERVRNNLHIVLCLSPIGNEFRVRLRQYPSLINCTTIDWFLDWPKEALLEVAANSLITLDILKTITGEPRVYDIENVTLTQEELRVCIADIFATIHQSVVDCSTRMILEMKRYNYVTPTNFLELVSGYKETLDSKRIEIASSANKLRNGLYKIDDTSNKVAGMTEELGKATKLVNQYAKECDKFLVIIYNQTLEADKQKAEVAEQSIKIKEDEIICQGLYDQALADLKLAMPALEEAMDALNSLNKKDLSEVKSFSRPPERVKLVLEAVMTLKQSEPSWAEAKRQLGDPNFLNQLKDFDKDHIPEKVLKKIAVFTRNPEFDPIKVGAQSLAAKSLAMWVIAIEKYAKIYKIVAPKKELADNAMASLKEKQLALYTAEQKLLQLKILLDKLQADYAEKMIEKEELVKKAEELRRNLERAATLIDRLSDERERWTRTVKQLDIDFDYLPGDCLISTAFVSYMGPFVSKYRESLMELWVTSVREMTIPCDPEYQVIEFLSDPAIIRTWNINGLPNDAFSTENGIIISRGSRWPLVIDPQCQALKWIKNMEAENELKVIDFGVPNYIHILEDALQNGFPALLQIASETVDPAVMPVLAKALVKENDKIFIKMGDKLLMYNERFRFFITTKMRNPHYPPEISTLATVVNFAIKEEGLEDQLLGNVVRIEKPALEKLKDSLIINIDTGKRTLVELEDELLRLLNESEGSLLENEELFETLESSKKTSAAVGKQLQSALVTQADIDIAREGYRPCANRASTLFFILNDLSQIDPMYQFSLDSYVTLFENSIRKSEKCDFFNLRINYLNVYHTYAVYRNTCRGLFEHHKLLFSFQICVKILLGKGQLSRTEFDFLLKGGIVLNREEQAENPSWLPLPSWDNITELDKLPGFHGIGKSFEQFSREWKEWYMSPEPENMNLVGQWKDICTPFQQMLLVRSLRLDRLSFSISKFIVENLGPKFVEPPVLDIKSVLEDSSNKTPLIFVLSPGVDPTNMLIGLAASYNMKEKFQTLSLGQGQAPIATALIDIGQREGHWVFLANCHLSLSWMPHLDKIVDVMQDGKSHTNFRLWLSSSPHPDFPIAILQSAIKMTTEPPKGLKANMTRLYQNISESDFTRCHSQEKYKKLLFALCFFHSVLVERKKFKNLGWNVVYSFNDSDFEVSENLLSIYLDEYEDTPWDALKYLIAGICYGGHVTDDWDRRLLDTYINQYFNEESINTPFYRLSSLVMYYIPRDGDVQSYRDYISTLPVVDSPQAFGQHPNSDMASLMGENRIFCETLMALQGPSSGGGEEYKEEKVLNLLSKILHKIPEIIDYDTTVKNIGTKRNPLDVVLLQEILRYNILLNNIKSSLVNLRKGIKGLVVISPDLEEVFQCIDEGRVPSQWLKAYPSLMNLGAWTQDLIERVSYFTIWANTVRPPVLFWLGAYTFPTGFLTAVLQIESRSTSVPIDLLVWDFTPIPIPPKDIVMPPNEGVYVRSLYLEGANWDHKASCLCEPNPLQLIAKLPVIQFRPVKSVRRKARSFYLCPVYYYPQRCGVQGRDAFVVGLYLKSGEEPPDHWIKRATAVLLNLSN
ncbi:dynein axonemal heavy chain 2 [Adelges cooleyi]|uniref:dynein axonemal heavy chain 2 n=1 Tax=Adelges cooleyi TaxID=133065 RepID=UPI00217F8C4A|nr:dynein axonemal heavy chain 2 [Adelges cooleyi]